MRPPSFWPGSIGHLPPIRVDRLKNLGVFGIDNRPDSTFNMRLTARLVNRTSGSTGTVNTLSVFKRLFSKKQAPLTGAPPVRRLKSHSAESGYVYQYFYQGQRPADAAIEFVFCWSADRKTWHSASVLVESAAVEQWERSHGRALASNERYAIAKMALLQAFDERADPVQMASAVRVRAADVEAIVEMLGL